MTDENREERVKALLVSTDPRHLEIGEENLERLPENKNADESAAIVADRPKLDAGLVLHEWSETVILRNRSQGPVQILGIKASCTCVDATAENLTLSPGGTTELKVSLPPEARDARFQHEVFLITKVHPSTEPVVKISGGYALPLTVAPPALTLRRVPIGQEARATVHVYPKSSRYTAEDLDVDIPDGLPITADFEPGPQGQIFLHVEWLGLEELGWHRQTISIVTRESRKPLGQPAFLAVEVVPKIAVTPDVVVFRPGLQMESFSRKLVLSSPDGTVEIAGASFEDHLFADAIVANPVWPNGESPYVELSASRDALTKLENDRTLLKIDCTSGEKVEVPIYVDH